MAIGEFGAAGAFPLSAPMYWFYEMSQGAVIPSLAMADATRLRVHRSLGGEDVQHSPIAKRRKDRRVAQVRCQCRDGGKARSRLQPQLLGDAQHVVHQVPVLDRHSLGPTR